MRKTLSLLARLAGAAPADEAPVVAGSVGRVFVVGSPNVGKSMLFNRLTGRNVTVSNYPGTTVEVARGSLRTPRGVYEVVDTPGIYALAPVTEEERVTFALLAAAPADAVLHVVDARNLDRQLPLTLQLAEAGLPLILVLNMVDEARAAGIRVDAAALARDLGLPVVCTVATRGTGVAELVQLIPRARSVGDPDVVYEPEIVAALAELAALPGAAPAFAARARAALLLQTGTREAAVLLPAGAAGEMATAGVAAIRARLPPDASLTVAMAVRRRADEFVRAAMHATAGTRLPPRERLSRIMMHPVYGVPILLAVLYVGLYLFVGRFGAGVLVDALQEVFRKTVGAWLAAACDAVLPWQVIRDLFTGEYGIVTLALRYAVAIIFPVVGTFFIAFAVLEDSGYLPRLAMLLDRVFKGIGLSGRAVIPLVLGFGCGTMATLVTRTLETRRERFIATLLLALAIPCSAQLGVIVGLLAHHPPGLLLWVGVVTVVFVLTGWLAQRLVPGGRAGFYMELPPLRLPRPGHVALKTVSRMMWYFREVLPLFVAASMLIWLGQVTGAFPALVRALSPVMGLLGLPDTAAPIFLFGFLRRDYGAAGLYDLQHAHALSVGQIAVAAVTLTLFLPCVAQFLVMGRERGARTALAVGGLSLVVAVAGGWVASVVAGPMGLMP